MHEPARVRLPGGQAVTLQDRIDELVAQHGSLRAVARVTEIDVGYLSRLRAYANVNPGRDKLRRLGLRRVVTYELLKPANVCYGAELRPN